jgi:hypothetical protein
MQRIVRVVLKRGLFKITRVSTCQVFCFFLFSLTTPYQYAGVGHEHNFLKRHLFIFILPSQIDTLQHHGNEERQ